MDRAALLPLIPFLDFFNFFCSVLLLVAYLINRQLNVFGRMNIRYMLESLLFRVLFNPTKSKVTIPEFFILIGNQQKVLFSQRLDTNWF